MYVLGLQNNDTDEYDQHVLVHEFQHFLEDAISRSDTPGGSHPLGVRLDMRLAFSEGFANAFSAMVLGNTLYSDSLGTSQSERFHFDVESSTVSPYGWFSEASNYSIAFDLYDGANRADADNVALGYGPIFESFRNELRTGQALTSVYPFVTALKSRVPASAAAIDELVEAQSIVGKGAFGAGETNSGDIAAALPVYRDLTPGGGSQRVCGTAEAGKFNRLGNRLFLKFSLAAARSVTVRATYTSNGSTAPFTPSADPDVVVRKGDLQWLGESDVVNNETLTVTLEAGDYTVEVYEYSHIEPDPADGSRGVTCMNVSVT
jgi:hypothetical protein